MKLILFHCIINQGETEKFFVSGGFALTHPNSVTVSVTNKFTCDLSAKHFICSLI
jgi:F0F1-type ATP synthase epsilon subunit